MIPRTDRDVFILAGVHLRRRGWSVADLRSKAEGRALDFGFQPMSYITLRVCHKSGAVGPVILEACVSTVQQAVDHLVTAGVLPASLASWTRPHAELLDRDDDLWSWHPAGFLREDDGAPLTREQLDAEFGPTRAVVA